MVARLEQRGSGFRRRRWTNVMSPFTWEKLRAALIRIRESGWTGLNCRDARAALAEGRLPARALVMRVDVDRSPAAAVTMAQLFRDESCRATFFYRLHAPDYDLDQSLALGQLHAVRDMGFEIGLHCEPLIVAHVTGKPPERALAEDIGTLSEKLGEPVTGAASHGDARYPHINNLDFWNDHRPEEFGLLYEAYDERTFGLFQASRYVSDSELVRWKAYERGVLMAGDHRSLEEHLGDSELPIYALVHPFLFDEATASARPD